MQLCARELVLVLAAVSAGAARISIRRNATSLGAASAANEKQPIVSAWFGVCSAPKNFEARQAVRGTWMTHAWAKSMTVKFVIGDSGSALVDRAVRQESKQYGDILKIKLRESYRGLVRKVGRLLQHGYWSGADWVFKIDDDVVPRMVTIANSLRASHLKGATALGYAGNFWTKSPVFRDPSHKWYIPYHVYSDDIFPKYANGPLYAVSHALAKVIAFKHFSLFWDKPIPLENVTVGRAVRRVSSHAEIKYIDINLPTRPDGSHVKWGCETQVSGLPQYWHAIPPAKMRCMWFKLSRHPDWPPCCA